MEIEAIICEKLDGKYKKEIETYILDFREGSSDLPKEDSNLGIGSEL